MPVLGRYPMPMALPRHSAEIPKATTASVSKVTAAMGRTCQYSPFRAWQAYGTCVLVGLSGRAHGFYYGREQHHDMQCATGNSW